MPIMVNIQFEQVTPFVLNRAALQQWVSRVAELHGRAAGTLTYVFCNDSYILDVNRQFLDHDYFTDIITFDYSTARRIAGDMVISVDTVRSNAEMLHIAYEQELRRVIIHGVLHLCGINDKGPGEREIMEHHENDALRICPDNLLTT